MSVDISSVSDMSADNVLSPATTVARSLPLEPPPPMRRLRVAHTTRYEYDAPVPKSHHRLHVRPVFDARQRLVSHALRISPDVSPFAYEDVFGNATLRFEISEPYTELEVTAESVVDVVLDDPFAFANVPIRPSFPLSWMPWELKMLAPYLSSIELPEEQLRELFDFAMSFAARNHHDLMETLFAMNLTLFREFEYVPGSTQLATTPYDVFHGRQGVCQDFANLFICLARLLAIPARYVCGYVYCPQADSLQSAASHAWVELYIPGVGWKGFDPTNGVLAHADHIRVAVGRNYRDTAPLAGTIYGSAQERMRVHVAVTEESNGAARPELSSRAEN
jgi:transglutaminase-like putative cysteine protease